MDPLQQLKKEAGQQLKKTAGSAGPGGAAPPDRMADPLGGAVTGGKGSVSSGGWGSSSGTIDPLANSGKFKPPGGGGVGQEIKPLSGSEGGIEPVTGKTGTGPDGAGAGLKVGNAKTGGPAQPGAKKPWNATTDKGWMNSTNTGQEWKQKNTVQGHMNRLLSEDSDWIKQNRHQAALVAAENGQSNSSLAAGQGQAAAINAALPIAQQDSGQRLSWMQQKLGHEQNQEMSNQQYAQQRGLAEQGVGHQKELAEQAYGHSGKLMEKEYGERTKLETSLQEMRNSGQIDLETVRQRGTEMQLNERMMQSYTAENSRMMRQKNDEIAEVQQAEGLTAEQKQAAIAEINTRFEATYVRLDRFFNEARDLDLSFLKTKKAA